MKKKLKDTIFRLTIVLLTSVTLCINLNMMTTFAEDAEESVDFNINAILPGNQIDSQSTYFDLKMEPGQKQTIEFVIGNKGTEKTTYTISINQAYTNAQGFIDYTNSKTALFDDSLKYKIDDIVTYEKEVEVEPQSNKKVPITIQMPDTPFDGQIMAGIQVDKKDTKEKSDGIASKVGYILGLNLRETDTEVKREMKLISVEPSAFNGSTSVKVEMKNPTMDAIGHLKYVVNVIDKKTKKNVRTVTYDNDMQMAPNSIYGFEVDWEGKRLVAGEYNLDLVVSDAKNNEWKFDEDFTITPKQAKDINSITVDADTNNDIPSWIYILIAVLLILVIGALSLIVLKSKRNKEKRKRKQSRKPNNKKKIAGKKSPSQTKKRKQQKTKTSQ